MKCSQTSRSFHQNCLPTELLCYCTNQSCIMPNFLQWAAEEKKVFYSLIAMERKLSLTGTWCTFVVSSRMVLNGWHPLWHHNQRVQTHTKNRTDALNKFSILLASCWSMVLLMQMLNDWNLLSKWTHLWASFHTEPLCFCSDPVWSVGGPVLGPVFELKSLMYHWLTSSTC